jgi:hypothetical protein
MNRTIFAGIYITIGIIAANISFGDLKPKERTCTRVMDLRPKHAYDVLTEIPKDSGEFYWCGK